MGLNIIQRNVIRRYLDQGMTPQQIADHFARLNELGPLEVVTIRSAAHELLNEVPAPPPPPAPAGRPALRVIRGGAAGAVPPTPA